MTRKSNNLILGAMVVIILGLVAWITIILLPRIISGQIVANTPETAAQIGATIIDYRLPGDIPDRPEVGATLERVATCHVTNSLFMAKLLPANEPD